MLWNINRTRNNPWKVWKYEHRNEKFNSVEDSSLRWQTKRQERMQIRAKGYENLKISQEFSTSDNDSSKKRGQRKWGDIELSMSQSQDWKGLKLQKSYIKAYHIIEASSEKKSRQIHKISGIECPWVSQ